MSIFLGGGGQPISNVEPRIGAIRLQTSQYGGALPLVYGRTRVSGNLINYANFTATAHTTEQSAGGKGGDVSISSTTYTYTADIQMAICEGPIRSINTVWTNKTRKALSKSKLTLFRGFDPQAPWPYLATATGRFVDSNGNPVTSGLELARVIAQYNLNGKLPPGYAIKGSAADLGYAGVGYVACAQYDLMNNAELPNHSFEVYALKSLPYPNITGARVSDVINDFLTNDVHGAGFPIAKLGSLEELRNYTEAAVIYISPALTEQRPAGDWLREWLATVNCEGFFSEGLLKFKTYGDKATTSSLTGEVFTPNLTPLYDLTDDDYLKDSGDDPVKVTRKLQADAYNQVQLECLDQTSGFNVTVVTADDAANISTHGIRAMPIIKAHEHTSVPYARRAAQRILQRVLYIRNTYEFKVGIRYALVEPMDLLTLTDSQLGLDRKLVRVLSTEETESGEITIVAEETLTGTAEAAEYAAEPGAGFEHDYNIDPGNVDAPIIFEGPLDLTLNGLEVWLGVSGGFNWGGCDVWVSTDNLNYQRVGTQEGSSRYGVTKSSVAVRAALDTVTQLQLDLTVSEATLTSSSESNAERRARTTLCYLDGEFVSYRTATLTDTYKYTLAELQRGLYHTTIAAHVAGKPFARCDTALFHYPFDESLIGATLYIKFLSFNKYGGAGQSLADVEPYTYRVTGSALTAPLDNVANLATVFRDGRLYLHWDRVVDSLRPVTYEVREGTTYASATIVGTVTDPEYLVRSDGTYWVSAIAGRARSLTATAVTVAGSRLSPNVVQTWDEKATSWTGAMSSGVSTSGGNLILTGSALLSTAASVSGITGLVSQFGGVISQGTYDLPAGHIVDVGTVQACNVSVTFSYYNDNPSNIFSTIPLVSLAPSIAGDYAALATVHIEIAVSDAGGTFGAWQKFVPGQYLGRKFKIRAVLESFDPVITPVVTALAFTVDMPDKVQTGTGVAIAAGGTAITFPVAFQIVPNVQITVTNAVAGDDIFITAGPTAAGFTVQIKNAGVGVARTINWLAAAY